MKIFNAKCFLLLTFISLSIVMQQCCTNCCKGGAEINYQVLNYKASRYWKVKDGKAEFLNPNQIVLDQNDTLNLSMKDSSIKLSNHFNRGDGSLMACSPSDNFELYHSRWDSMCIQTLIDFDSLHPAGSNIDKFFAIDLYDRFYVNRVLYSLGNLRKVAASNSGEFTLVLCKKPVNTTAQFKFKYFDLTSGDSAISRTELLIFN